MRSFRSKLKGSTLTESLIALVLITLSFGLAGMLHGSVLGHDRSVDRVRALGMIGGMKEHNGVPEDTKWEKKGLRIEREVAPYQGSERLYRVTYRVYSGEQRSPFMEINELVHAKE